MRDRDFALLIDDAVNELGLERYDLEKAWTQINSIVNWRYTTGENANYTHLLLAPWRENDDPRYLRTLVIERGIRPIYFTQYQGNMFLFAKQPDARKLMAVRMLASNPTLLYSIRPFERILA